MNFITNKISMDLMRPEEPPVIHGVQGEKNVRNVQISLFCDGEPWQIPDGTMVSVRYGGVLHFGGYYDTLPDGARACSYEGNVITIILAPQMMAVAGAVLTQVELSNADQTLATFSFKLQVTMNPAAGILEPEVYVNWLEWMEKQLEAYMEAAREDGTFAGPEGPQGAAAEVTGTEVRYQAGTSQSEVPTGSWQETIPYVPAGQFLWTRTTIIFNHTAPVTFYTVSRMGIDGMGSVTSVAGISPDEGGNVQLTADHVGAMPASGGMMTGPINMNGQKLTGLNYPEGDSEAATRGYTVSLVKKASPRNLLDNSDFADPVCQRGTSFTEHSAKYTIDRWTTTGGVAVSDGCIDFENFSSSGANNLYQYAVPGTIVPGKTYTAACKLADGTLCVGSAVAKSGAVTRMFSSDTVGLQIAANYNSKDQFAIRNETPGQVLSIQWAALYEGEYTEDTLPEYHPKGYAHEFLECLRYFYRFVYSVNGFYFPVIQGITQIPGFSFPVEMRIVPSMTINALKSWTSAGISDISGQISSKRCTTGGLQYIELTSQLSGTGLINLSADFSADL